MMAMTVKLPVLNKLQLQAEAMGIFCKTKHEQYRSAYNLAISHQSRALSLLVSLRVYNPLPMP